MKLFIFPLLFLFGSLYADEDEKMVIESEEAHYDGKSITLTGTVSVEHEFGQISAHQVILSSDNQNKNLRFANLKIVGDVQISLKDGGQLSCSKAEIDYHNRKGHFFGTPHQEDVVYTENDPHRNKNKTPLIVKSQRMTVEIDPYHLTSSENVFRQIIAEENVTINYHHDLIAVADFAEYQKGSDDFPTKAMISLKSNKQGGTCQVTNRNGDLISASQLDIDINKQKIFFANPKGTFCTHPENEQGVHQIDFSANQLEFDLTQDLMILRDHVAINQIGMGQLFNDREVKVYRNDVGGHKKIRSIQALEKTTLNYPKENKTMPHSLTCYGILTIDHEKLQGSLESPKNEEGKVIEGKQICFQDRFGEIYADTVKMSYDVNNSTITPVKITLMGHVQILNRTAADCEDQGKFLQFALADSVEYYPNKKKMYLKASEDSRVLFFDKTNNLKISAPALKISRDQKKDSVQGFGDVRFSFVEKEFAELRERFHQHEKNKK